MLEIPTFTFSFCSDHSLRPSFLFSFLFPFLNNLSHCVPLLFPAPGQWRGRYLVTTTSTLFIGFCPGMSSNWPQFNSRTSISRLMRRSTSKSTKSKIPNSLCATFAKGNVSSCQSPCPCTSWTIPFAGWLSFVHRCQSYRWHSGRYVHRLKRLKSWKICTSK